MNQMIGEQDEINLALNQRAQILRQQNMEAVHFVLEISYKAGQIQDPLKKNFIQDLLVGGTRDWESFEVIDGKPRFEVEPPKTLESNSGLIRKINEFPLTYNYKSIRIKMKSKWQKIKFLTIQVQCRWLREKKYLRMMLKCFLKLQSLTNTTIIMNKIDHILLDYQHMMVRELMQICTRVIVKAELRQQYMRSPTTSLDSGRKLKILGKLALTGLDPFSLRIEQ